MKAPCAPSGRRYIPMVYMGRLDRQESMSIVLLPLDVNLAHQGSALDFTRPTKESRSLIRILESLIGIPKLVMGKVHTKG
jgi:hypothetical protein